MVVLICGVVAITALEFGNAVTSALVRIPALITAVLLIVLSADAALRTWRSAWAWLPVNPGRGLFRFVWAGALIAVLLGSVGVIFYLFSG